MAQFTLDENKLIAFARKRFPEFLKNRRKRGALDTLYTAVMSNSGKIYEGTVLESDVATGTVCCERAAIAQMILNESDKAKIKSILVAGPVGKGGKLSPCGTCRSVINQYSDGKATVLVAGAYFERSQTNFDFLFKNVKKYTIKQLYPDAWSEGKWG